MGVSWDDVLNDSAYQAMSDEDKSREKALFIRAVSKTDLPRSVKQVLLQKVHGEEQPYKASLSGDVAEGVLQGASKWNPVSASIMHLRDAAAQKRTGIEGTKAYRKSPSLENRPILDPLTEGLGAAVGTLPAFMYAASTAGPALGSALVGKAGMTAKTAQVLGSLAAEAGTGAVVGAGSYGTAEERLKAAGTEGLANTLFMGGGKVARHLLDKRVAGQFGKAVAGRFKDTTTRGARVGARTTKESFRALEATRMKGGGGSAVRGAPEALIKSIEGKFKRGTLTYDDAIGALVKKGVGAKHAQRLVDWIVQKPSMKGVFIKGAAQVTRMQHPTMAQMFIEVDKVDPQVAVNLDKKIALEMRKAYADKRIVRANVLKKLEEHMLKKEIPKDNILEIMAEVKRRYPPPSALNIDPTKTGHGPSSSFMDDASGFVNKADTPYVSPEGIPNPARVTELSQKAPRLSKLGNEDDLRNLISEEEIAEKTLKRPGDYTGVGGLEEREFTEHTRKVLTDDEVDAIAQEFDFPVERFKNAKPGDVVNVENMRAAARVMRNLRAEAQEMIRHAHFNPNDSEGLKLAAQAATNYEHSLRAMRGWSAESGRVVREMRNFQEFIHDPTKLATNANELIHLRSVMSMFVELMPQGTHQFDNFVAKSPFGVTSFDKVYTLWLNAMLSNPKTHFVNAISNFITIATRYGLEKPVEALLETGKAALTGQKSAKTFREVGSAMYGLVEAVPDAIRVFGKHIKNPELAGRGALKYGEDMTIATSKQAWGGRLGTMPGTMLGAADDAFKTLVERASVREQAWRHAVKEGLQGYAAKMRVAELINNPSVQMINKSIADAQYVTFTKPLGPLASSISQFRARHKIMRILFPFFRTPVNIAKYGLERMPFGGLASRVVGTGKSSTAEAMSKQALGGLFAAGISLEVMKGNLSGSGPRDKGQRSALYATGWKPYSVRFKDTWFSYARMEPVSTVLGFIADTQEAYKEGSLADEKLDYFGSKAFFSMSQLIINKTYTRTLADLIEAIQDPDRYAADFVTSMGGSLIPAAVGGIAQTVDPIMREIESPLEKPWEILQARTPWLSQKLPPKVDVFGDPIVRPGSVGSRLMSPVTGSAVVQEPYVAEIYRLRLGLGKATRGKGNQRLTSGEYTELLSLQGAEMKARLRNLMNSGSYNSPTGARTEEAKDAKRVRMIRVILAAARKVGKGKFQKGLPKARRSELLTANPVRARETYGE